MHRFDRNAGARIAAAVGGKLTEKEDGSFTLARGSITFLAELEVVIEISGSVAEGTNDRALLTVTLAPYGDETPTVRIEFVARGYELERSGTRVTFHPIEDVGGPLVTLVLDRDAPQVVLTGSMHFGPTARPQGAEEGA